MSSFYEGLGCPLICRNTWGPRGSDFKGHPKSGLGRVDVLFFFRLIQHAEIKKMLFNLSFCPPPHPRSMIKSKIDYSRELYNYRVRWTHKEGGITGQKNGGFLPDDREISWWQKQQNIIFHGPHESERTNVCSARTLDTIIAKRSRHVS